MSCQDQLKETARFHQDGKIFWGTEEQSPKITKGYARNEGSGGSLKEGEQAENCPNLGAAVLSRARIRALKTSQPEDLSGYFSLL